MNSSPLTSSDTRQQLPRVVVTGIGTVSPVGQNITEMWASLEAGKSGVDYITSFDTSAFEVKIGAEVRGFDASRYVSRKQAQRMDRFTQFAVAATFQALESARLKIDPWSAPDCGVIIGNSVCGLLSISGEWQVLTEKGPDRVSPILAPTMTGDAASVQVSLLTGAMGPNYAPSAACSSGSDAIGQAFNAIRLGEAKIMIAGGTEAPLMPIVIAAFSNIRALAARNDHPKEACRPFDAKRNGFVMGEGAAIMILEEESHALARGAPVIAELAGYGATSDAFHLTQPSPDGASAIRAVRLAMERGGVNPGEIDYINAHGTATVLNDRTETNVIKTVFGDYAKKIPVSASKSMIGHLLGAAGSIEAVITLLAMQHGVLPPTINLTHPDPECDLDYVPNQARPKEVKTAMSNSFGFGGHNSVLVFRKYR
jgi:3-oxoacyl-[acyl-carrier-protein] synthase II